jgi:hypothetical protein
MNKQTQLIGKAKMNANSTEVKKRQIFTRELLDAVVIANREASSPDLPKETKRYQNCYAENLQFAFEQFASGKIDGKGKFKYDSDIESVLDYLAGLTPQDIREDQDMQEAWIDMNEFLQDLADEVYFGKA